MTNKKLRKLWYQVPPDYYEQGTKNNILKWLWHKQKVESFKKLVRNEHFKNILDVGCASGFMTNKVSHIFPNSEVSGVDVYQPAINYGKKQYPHIKFLLGDAHKLPFRGNSFDLIICYETVEHVENPQQILQEIKRVMRKGGFAIVSMDSGNLLFRLGWWFWEKTAGVAWQDAHIHPYHHQELEQIIKEVGFKIIKKHFSHLGLEVSFVLKK